MYLSKNKHSEVSDADCRLNIDQNVQLPTILDSYM